MKVLHVISSGGMYGAEAVILQLLAGMRGTSELAVFARGALYERAAGEGLPVHSLECRGQMDWRLPARLRALAERTGADLVHAHGYKADVYAWLGLRGTGVRLVSTCHTWYDNDAALRLYGGLDRWVLGRYAQVVAVSEDVRQRLLAAGVRAERVKLVPNGMSPGPAPVRRELGGRLRVGLVGRLAPEKGVDILLRAAPRVLAEAPEAEFVVAGDGPDRAKLEGLIAELGLGARACLAGRVEEMGAFYGSLDVAVSASRQEGLPMALLEAMARGLPIVATRVGEVPSLIRDGSTGVLVEPEDPETLAAGIVLLLGDAELGRQYGAAARALVEREFSAERMVANYLRVYTEALAECRG